ncbi:hypothetical protein IWX90DRAFT_271101 [Phyllosticta citrichinensis]|uniref:Uncharacterized protein n=1 Tax=Phyllosticta citrichinensis TaxID=1130410 RepID=A0ABR1XMY8_9PEZI
MTTQVAEYPRTALSFRLLCSTRTPADPFPDACHPPTPAWFPTTTPPSPGLTHSGVSLLILLCLSDRPLNQQTHRPTLTHLTSAILFSELHRRRHHTHALSALPCSLLLGELNTFPVRHPTLSRGIIPANAPSFFPRFRRAAGERDPCLPILAPLLFPAYLVPHQAQCVNDRCCLRRHLGQACPLYLDVSWFNGIYARKKTKMVALRLLCVW